MELTEALRPEHLYRRCNPDQFSFQTTADLPDLQLILGQNRAVEAIRFGIDIGNSGYNIYALGPAGVGKHSITIQLLSERLGEGIAPRDWCYVNNFDDAQRPLAISLPPGKGRVFRNDMDHLIDDLAIAIPALFESDEYRGRVREIEGELKARQDEAIAAIQNEARANNTDLVRTPGGFAFAPAKDGEVLEPEKFDQLPEKERKRISAVVVQLQARLRLIVRQMPQWRRETREKIEAFNRETVISATEHQIDALRAKYADQDKLLAYLDAVQEDIIANIDDFRQQDENAPPALMDLPGRHGGSFRRYAVNLLVDRGEAASVPVVYEDNPTFQNLMGRLEHVAMLGALVTDFSLIRAGSLHRANGGYLLLDAYKVLTQPFVWEGLKRALRSHELRVESLDRLVGLASTVTLEPEPIPLSVKVVLLGDRWLYYLLCEFDAEFLELFKVAADFEEDLPRDAHSEPLFAQLIATMARKHQLRPLDRLAVARVLEQASRLSGDSQKFSTHLRSLSNLLMEANHHAALDEVVSAVHVQQAIDAQQRRSGRIKERLHESIERGITLIATSGTAIGQINGLSVIQLGDVDFGIPHRISARVRPGEGELIDIEREVELGGPIHSKGVMILAGFLGSRYAANIPLSLAATLVSEQSYGEVEGDSASSAELYALLSALAQAPLKQALAVTGSVNQHGEIQAIGGVNEKIEGFFDVCAQRGLAGDQGVIIPASNVSHLMLRRDVVEAAERGLFHIYPVAHVDEGMGLLTGTAAGKADVNGNFPVGSVNSRVCTRLRAYAELRLTYGERDRRM